jgi:hypothetical protein
LHAPPLLPHSVFAVPGTHELPPQQPPLHGCSPVQCAVHVWVAGSHAVFSGQSLTDVQPQNVDPPLATQA